MSDRGYRLIEKASVYAFPGRAEHSEYGAFGDSWCVTI